MTIHVKNMVCPRCIMAVENVLTDLELQPAEVVLGQINLQGAVLEQPQKNNLHQRLQALGFELLEGAATIQVEHIKKLIISHIHYSNGEELQTNWSQLLTAHLHKDYSYLSKLFSEKEGITIEQYIIRQKIEKVKELLQNNQLTLSQIAFDMQYSSTAHLSAQFKKITGLTPSQYKQAAASQRNSLDAV